MAPNLGVGLSNRTPEVPILLRIEQHTPKPYSNLSLSLRRLFCRPLKPKPQRLEGWAQPPFAPRTPKTGPTAEPLSPEQMSVRLRAQNPKPSIELLRMLA